MFGIREALRAAVRSKRFTVLAALLVVVAVATFTAVFCVVRTVLLRPLPYASAHRVVYVTESVAGTRGAFVGPAESSALLGGRQVIADVATVLNVTLDATGGDGLTELHGYVVTPNLFRLLGARAERGRTFVNVDAGVSEPVVILSDDAWRGTFGADSTLIGRTIVVDGVPHLLIGVMPPDVRFPDSPSFHRVAHPAFWVLFPTGATPIGLVFALLRPGVSERALNAYGAQVATRLAPDPRLFPDGGGQRVTFAFTPLRDQIVTGVAGGLWVLLAAMAILALVMFVNVGGLWAMRVASRRTEIAVRLALGGNRRQVVATWCAGGSLIGAAGGVMACLVAAVGVKLFVHRVPLDVPRIADARIGLTDCAVGLVVAFSGAALAGALPALAATRGPQRTLLGNRTPSSGRSRTILRRLAIVEIILCTLLAYAATLLIRAEERIEQHPLGFEPANLVTAEVDAPVRTRKDLALADGRFRALADSVGALPGVRSAAYVFPLPLTSLAALGPVYRLHVQNAAAGSIDISGEVTLVSPAYFRTMHIPFVFGRDFTAADTADSMVAGVIDEATAARLWPGVSPIGRRLSTSLGSESTRVSIVGVVRPVAAVTPGRVSGAQLYLPLASQHVVLRTMVIRTITPGVLAATLQRAIRDAAPNVALGAVTLMDAVVGRALAARRLLAFLVAFVATLAAIIALSGVYAAVAHGVASRTAEIGVRLAVGASQGRVIWLVVAESMLLSAVGAGIGSGIGAAATRLASSTVQTVRPADGLWMIPIGMFVVLVAALASYVPAQRASHIDIVRALRSE